MIFGIVYSFFFTTYENIKVSKTIKEFKNRSTFEYEIPLKVGNVEYYRSYNKVTRETSAELNDTNNVFYDDEKLMLGIEGDIFVTGKSPFPELFGIHQFVSYYYGGHAAILTYENDKAVFIESTGFPASGETIFDYIFHKGNKEHNLNSTIDKKAYNYWQTPSSSGLHHYYDLFYRDKYIGLRPTNPFVEEENSKELYEQYIETAIDRANEKYEDEALYNFLFFLNMRYKYYCTDLMSRVYEESYEAVKNGKDDYRSKGYGKKMNDDGFITSVNDLILSRDTFMTFYVEIKEEVREGTKVLVEYVYYLEDIEE